MLRNIDFKQLHTVLFISSASIATFIANAMGGLNKEIKILLFCMVIDYITGVLAAILDKNISSAIGKKGIIKKIGMLILVSCLYVFDHYVFNMGGSLQSVICLICISNEAISILENLDSIGVPLPQSLIKFFKQFKEMEEEQLDDDLKQIVGEGGK